MLCLETVTTLSVRNLVNLNIEPATNLNLFYGQNASGKTSILEAIYLLSRIKSFRTNRIRDVICKGENKLQVIAKGKRDDKPLSVGIEKGYGVTAIKCNGESVQTASEQARKLPVYIITPDHHVLFTGTPKDRRHWLDWSLFHVEQNYIRVWKNYHRALRHRNTLLKSESDFNADELSGWEKLMMDEAVEIDRMRNNYIEELSQYLNEACLPCVLPGTGSVQYLNNSYKNETLSKLLFNNRTEDVKKGYTTAGPHRVDISFSFNDFDAAKHLSRGQMKLFGAAIVSSQINILKEKGFDALLLVDDLDAELDEDSARKMFRLLKKNRVQTFISCLTNPAWFDGGDAENAVFHVKHGEVKKIVE